VRRELIRNKIKNMPGISYNEIRRQTNLSNGVLTHHIIQLLEKKEIEKEGKNRAKYFLKSIPKNDRKIITILRNQTNNDICKCIMNHGKDSMKVNDVILDTQEIAKNIKRSKSTISASLKVLQKNNVIERTIMGKKSKLKNDIGYKIVRERFFGNFLLKYKL